MKVTITVRVIKLYEHTSNSQQNQRLCIEHWKVHCKRLLINK